MATSNEGYWSRSWALLTRDKGWYKPVLALAAARLVPIVGGFGADGYALEWGRLTSWGVDSSPKQKDVDVTGCIRTGARAFVVALGYGLILALAQGILSSVLGDGLGGMLGMFLSVVGLTVVVVAQLRSAIYQNIGAGYQMNRIFDMLQRDFNGFARVMGLGVVMGLVVGFVASMLIGIVVLTSMGGLILDVARADSYGYDEVEMAASALRYIAAAMPALCISVYILNILTTLSNLIMTTSVGLWMRQFDVRNWGESGDPLPGSPVAPTDAAPTYAAPATPTAASSYVPPQQSDAGYVAGVPTQAPTPASQPTPAPQPAPTETFASKEPTWEVTKATETVEPQEPAEDDALVSDIPIVPIAGYAANGTEDAPAQAEAPAAEAAPEVDAAPEADTTEDVPDTIFLRDFDENQEPTESEVPSFTLDEVYGEADAATVLAAGDDEDDERDADDDALDKMLNAVKQAAVEKEKAEAESAAQAPAVPEAPEATEDEIIAQMEQVIRESTVEEDEPEQSE